MIDSLTFGKLINNLTKLDEELRLDPITGPTFSYVTRTPTELRLFFSQALTQTVISRASEMVNDFIEVDLFDIEFDTIIRRQVEGNKIYQKIVARLNVDGNVYTGIDQGLALYPNFTVIRNLLHDGFLEFALRYLVQTLEPSGMFSADQIVFAKLMIRQSAKSFGATDQMLDAIEVAEEI
jgi:hypothetical protein